MKQATATIRDLRTRFPKIRQLLDRQGEIVVTDHGRPIIVLTAYAGDPDGAAAAFDYYGRLTRRMPRAMTAATRRRLDEANRGER